jgi:hypothetical protein
LRAGGVLPGQGLVSDRLRRTDECRNERRVEQRLRRRRSLRRLDRQQSDTEKRRRRSCACEERGAGAVVDALNGCTGGLGLDR